MLKSKSHKVHKTTHKSKVLKTTHKSKVHKAPGTPNTKVHHVHAIAIHTKALRPKMGSTHPTMIIPQPLSFFAASSPRFATRMFSTQVETPKAVEQAQVQIDPKILKMVEETSQTITKTPFHETNESAESITAKNTIESPTDAPAAAESATTTQTISESITTAASSQQPAYSQFKRIIANGSHKFEPTESYFDENGDECLVVYEASPEIVAKTLLERKRALLNTVLTAPGVAALSAYFIPAPYSYIMFAACAIVGLVNFARLYGLSAFVTKITAVWPHSRSEITSKLHSNLQEALAGLTPLPGEKTIEEEPENEFQQRKKHNEKILEELAQTSTEGENILKPSKSVEDGPVVEDGPEKLSLALQKAKQAQEDYSHIDDDRPVYPQPGVDPMGRVFQFNPHAPDTITWKFGWSDATNLAKGETPPLFDRQNFAEQVRLWAQLPDPDFPEYIYVDRLNNGKNFLYQKVPLSSLAAVWSVPVVPPAIPQITPEQIEQLQGLKHDSQAVLFRADNTVTGLFPKFVKHDVAFNQLIFASTINARNEVKEKFAQVKGRMKL